MLLSLMVNLAWMPHLWHRKQQFFTLRIVLTIPLALTPATAKDKYSA